MTPHLTINPNTPSERLQNDPVGNSLRRVPPTSLCTVAGHCSRPAWPGGCSSEHSTTISFVEGIKTGECPPWAKDTVRAFLLKEEGGNRVMLTILIPSAELKNALPFFVESGPKANPLWAQSNETWKDPNTPIFATGSEAFLVRGEANANKNIKGKYFGQYQLGWNGTIDEWVPQFTVPEANEFHNSVGIEFSVAHKLDLKTPGNTYKTKARNGLEVFHCFNSVDGAKAFEKAFAPDSPFFVNEPKYVGPYVQTIWKVVDDIVFKA